MAWVYILHFDDPLHHAKHYSGVTADLEARLRDHANGFGARLTQVLWQKEMDWSVGSLFQFKCTDQSLRQIEGRLKKQHNAPEYCSVCMAGKNKVVPGTIEIDLALLYERGIPLTSQEYRQCQRPTKKRTGGLSRLTRKGKERSSQTSPPKSRKKSDT